MKCTIQKKKKTTTTTTKNLKPLETPLTMPLGTPDSQRASLHKFKSKTAILQCLQGKDVFVSLSTGSGKAFQCYYDRLTILASSIRHNDIKSF